ncbi:hypothetical protein OPT61_g7458 [Boeremia exigua]|uniref:Uncharacterized protein n=1 Tax=Boeremia exigua TaxID=749465 RepID=A0ACC2I243_9PLEO|nr:hypothetical protein OPT61_g7458 [Boeremia exigua]
MGLTDGFPVPLAVVTVFLLWSIGKLVAFFEDRRRYQKLPGPPHSLLFGHLISVGKVAAKLPGRAHPHTLSAQLSREYDLPTVFYIDPRPFSTVSLVIVDPDVARQVAEVDLPKHPILVDVLEPFMGRVNMLTTSGPLWKKWRSAFNPGFSVQNIVGQVPMMVDCCREFVRLLDEHSSADRVFRMEEEATKITIDIIGKAICGHDFGCLTTGSRFVEWLRAALSWARDHQSLSPFHRYSLLRPIASKYYRRKMHAYVGKVLDDRFAQGSPKASQAQKKKTVIDLALELYAKENRGETDASATTMDAEFRNAAIDNILVFLFAGHDTTSSTLCYCYKLLNEHPHTLAAARKELDEVFGVDVSAADQLRENPFLVNKLDYLLAVIKEVLRLWSPGSTARLGRKDYFVRDPASGEMLPTEGVNVWIPSFALGRSKRIWGEDVDTFKPERFLPQNAAQVPAEAWRPFEKGPRNCIGQELSLIELKTVLALTLREFDVRAAFDELPLLSNDGSMWTKDSSFQRGPQEVFGDPMYQVLLASAKPREGMPTRVKRRRAF